MLFPNSFKNGVGVQGMEVGRICPPGVIFLPLEAAVEAAVYEEAFLGGAIAVGEAI